jgi:hypothetical protein
MSDHTLLGCNIATQSQDDYTILHDYIASRQLANSTPSTVPGQQNIHAQQRWVPERSTLYQLKAHIMICMPQQGFKGISNAVALKHTDIKLLLLAMTVSFRAQRSQSLPRSDAKRLTPEIADAYFSRDILENHRQEYNLEREYERKLAEEIRLQRKVQEVQSRLLGASTPTAAKVQDELEVAQDVLPNSPKPKAVDFDLLERLLPGCRLKDSKDFSRPSDATMHEPLPGPGWFRLLVIEPWYADNDKLRCNLRAVRLDDAAGRYSALSYSWSQPVRGAVQGLLCNGLAIDVGENLRLALENIRYRTLPRIVWVDALCINQDNPAERNQQVQLMGKIYQQAIETIVWLGDFFPRGSTWPEFDAICKVVKKWDKSLKPYYESRDKKGKLCRTEPGISRNQRNWDASLASSFFGCPWFERRWVI